MAIFRENYLDSNLDPAVIFAEKTSNSAAFNNAVFYQ